MRLDYKWQAALITALGLFMAVLDNTIVSVALPQMAHTFHTDISTITWVATAYFLAQAAVIPVTGYLSDRIGSKTVFLSALALFTIGSALCAISPSHTLLIAFRVLQGIGGGALFPTAFAIIYRVFPPEERGPASAVIGVPILLAPAFGPTLGGYLTTTFDWHAIFTINIPIGIIAFTLAAIFLRGRAADRAAMGGEIAASQRFDLLGLVLAMGGFTTLVYGITEAGTQGWGDRTVDIYLAIGAVLLIAFVIVELRSNDPVMDMRLFKNYTFTISNVLMWALGAFLFGSLFLLPYFFEQVEGLTPLSAGEILISQG
ncbi:MAG TPA: DHA2 family efflux MFS transporter permease subunit, partial [Ktedonobacterales bacterium]|nr:DHA2 family efflux MFS transporter permease subunit [Ktedonobacterales bacterium]